MNNFLKMIWSDHKTELILGIVGALGGIALIVFSYPAFLSPSDTIQSITLILLVVVTTSYAKSAHNTYKATSAQVTATKEATEVNRQAVQVAIDSEHNAVAPLINLRLVESTHFMGIMSVDYENLGKGPALDLMVWIKGDDEQFHYLQSDAERNRHFRPAIREGETVRCDWSQNMDISPTQPLPTINSGFDVIAEYTDVFRSRFESKLTVINQFDREFSYRQVRNESE